MPDFLKGKMQFHLADFWIPIELSRNQSHPLRQDRSKQCLRDGKSSMLTKHLKFKVQSPLFFSSVDFGSVSKWIKNHWFGKKILKYLITVVILTRVAEPSSFKLEVMGRAVPVPPTLRELQEV